MSRSRRETGVAAVVGRVRRYLLRRAALAAGLWVGAALAGVLVLAWVAAGPEGWPQGTPAPLLLDTLAALSALAAGGLLLRWWWSGLAEARVAATVEEATGLPEGVVRGTMELGRGLPPGISAGLASRAQGDVLRQLRAPAGRLAGRPGQRTSGWLRSGGGALSLLAPVLAVLAVSGPDRAREAWTGLSRPLALLVKPALPALVVRPGDVEVPRGASFEVQVEAPGRNEVVLHWQAAGDVPLSRAEPVDQEGVARFAFASIDAPVEYRAATADGARSRTYRVVPLDPLFVGEVSVELTFPPHTGRVPEEYERDLPPLVVPVGTRVRVEGRASRPLRSGGLSSEDGVALDLDVEGPRFRGAWAPVRSGLYHWSFQDDEGAEAELVPAPVDLTLVPDSAPQIAIVFPGRDTVLPLSLRQPLVLEARDDYGLARIELVAYRVTRFGERMAPVIQGQEVAGTRAALARPVLDVSEWGLSPGDTVRYHARVVDNSPRGQTAQSREFVLHMPGPEELRRDVQHRLDQVADRVESLAAEAARAGEESRDLERRTASAREAQREAGRRSGRGEERSGQRLDYQDREDVRRTAERQQEILDAVDSLRAEMEEMSRALREAGMADPDLRRDLQELQRLLSELSTPELRDRMQALLQDLETMDSRSASEALEQLARDQQAMRDRLERSLEQFRQAAVEQDFRATSSEAEALALEERALAEALREGSEPEARARQQEALDERASELEARMERLRDRLERMEEGEARDGVESAMERMAEAREAMAQAQQDARGQRPRSAGERADDAARSLERTAAQLQDAQSEMLDERQAEVERALQRTADDALALARRQEELRERIRRAGPQEMNELRGDEAALLQGVRNMAENLASAGSRMPSAEGREVSASLGQAMQSLQRTMDGMGQRRPGAPSPASLAEQAVEALNRAAMTALAAGQRVSESGPGSAEEQVMETLEAIARQQGSLFNQSGALMPLQLGEQALGNQLQEMAQGQQSVAGDLGELARNPEAAQRALGDLEALAREAEALAQQLAGGRLDRETLERQERLFHRLLDAGRLLEKEDELSDRRVAETARAFTPRDVMPIPPEALGGFRWSVPDAAQLQQLTPAQRLMVLEYFERLNRQGTPRSAAPPSEESRP